jgi:hypothetical protein
MAEVSGREILATNRDAIACEPSNEPTDQKSALLRLHPGIQWIVVDTDDSLLPPRESERSSRPLHPHGSSWESFSAVLGNSPLAA